MSQHKNKSSHTVASVMRAKLKNNRLYNNSIISQCARLLKELETQSCISTFDGRDRLGIPHIAGRILDLRKAGYKIETHWVVEHDNNGIKHRIAQYLYHGRKESPNV